MKVLEKLEIKNYRNLKSFYLDNLSDLNILIGPNNSGKTGILQGIEKILKKINIGSSRCKECKEKDAMGGLKILFDPSDYYYHENTNQFVVKLKLAKDIIDKWNEDTNYRTEVSEKKKNAGTHFDPGKEIELVSDQNPYEAISEHNTTIFTISSISWLQKSCLYIPSDRMNNRKGDDGQTKPISEYIKLFKLKDKDRDLLRTEVSKLVEPRFYDWQDMNLIEKTGNFQFTSNFEIQGSGLKALITVVADILFKENSVILIDEPELGLNPFVKQRFLKFLIERSRDKQIFTATQDSTFLNPILWNGVGDGVDISVYMYSALDNSFTKIDTANKAGHTGIFAGYLPHTVSLKDIHIYLEGPSDAYIFQIFLEKYLRKNIPEEWFIIFNRIGIFYLGGDLYQHLLYTIPESPYKAAVILDGDKRNAIKKMLESYNSFNIPKSELKYADNPNEVGGFLSQKKVPVYCLKEKCIEAYLGLDCEKLSENYNKVKDGPKKADGLADIPQEINDLIEVILGTLGFGKKRFAHLIDSLAGRPD
jgi:energy-coupling factor transporter ATP-binding protein EcfA2